MPAKTPTEPAQVTAPSAPPAVPDEAVTPLIRGVAVLRELTEAGGTLSPSALERATGLARSTVDRITATLARMEYVRVDGRDVTLTPRVMELGNAYLGALRLPALLSAPADALADALDESVSLAVADRDGIRFIHQATRRRALSLSFRIGDLLPAERTAPGPLFATAWTDTDWRRWRARRAADPQDQGFPAVPPPRHTTPDEDFVRRTTQAAATGWALDDQLIEPGLVAVSVPVRDPGTGGIACVASVVSHTSRHTAANLTKTLLPHLRKAVKTMESTLRQPEIASPRSHPRTGLALWTGASKQELGRGFVESLARGLTVLTAFGEVHPELTLTQVAEATGLSRATARRALITYTHLGLVEQPGPRTFRLTPQVLSLGFPPLSRTTLASIATPHLHDLTAELQEPSSLAVLPSPGADEIQIAARAAVRRVMSADIAVGTRLPARETALGRVLLAAGESTHALLDEELEAGLRSLAVPVHDRTGRVIAAIGTTTHAARRTPEDCLTTLLPALREAAARIETDLHTASRFTHVRPT